MLSSVAGFTESEKSLRSRVSAKRAIRRTLLLIHGSGTLGESMRVLKDVVDKEGYDVETIRVPIDPVPLVSVLFEARRQAVRSDMEKQIVAVIHNNAFHDEVSIVAHSYGTYLLAWWLNEKQVVSCRNLILLAAIVRRQEIAELTKMSDRVIVDVAVDDKVPCIAQAFRWDAYEATGSFGLRGHRATGNGQLVDRFFFEGTQKPAGGWLRRLVFGAGHSYHLDADHFRERVLPIITHDEFIPESTASRRLDQKSVHALRWVGISGIVLGAVALACFIIKIA